MERDGEAAMTTPNADTQRLLTECDAISCDADVVSGTPVFRGTRVPATALFDYLLHGKPLSEFYDDFPTVSQEQVLTVLRAARQHVRQPTFPPRERSSHGV